MKPEITWLIIIWFSKKLISLPDETLFKLTEQHSQDSINFRRMWKVCRKIVTITLTYRSNKFEIILFLCSPAGSVHSLFENLNNTENMHIIYSIIILNFY